MYYVYVLRSLKDKMLYTGFTGNLKKRYQEHKDGLVYSTKNRRPLEVIYYEAYTHRDDGLRREKYLKSGMGKRDLRNRLRKGLTG
jgi:putative endonuclease